MRHGVRKHARRVVKTLVMVRTLKDKPNASGWGHNPIFKTVYLEYGADALAIVPIRVLILWVQKRDAHGHRNLLPLHVPLCGVL